MGWRDDSWIWIPVTGAVLGILASRTKGRSASCITPVSKGQWSDPDAPRRIRAIAARIEAVTGQAGLGDFLAGVAYIESRGNPRAGSDEGNRARGWFGMRPQSARVDDLGLSPAALKDEEDAVALAAWYAHRCQTYAAPGQVMDWLAVRRCWGIPKHVDDLDHPGYHEQLAYGLAQAGVSCDFMRRRAFPPGYRWPGVWPVIAAARGETIA